MNDCSLFEEFCDNLLEEAKLSAMESAIENTDDVEKDNTSEEEKEKTESEDKVDYVAKARESVEELKEKALKMICDKEKSLSKKDCEELEKCSKLKASLDKLWPNHGEDIQPERFDGIKKKINSVMVTLSPAVEELYLSPEIQEIVGLMESLLFIEGDISKPFNYAMESIREVIVGSIYDDFVAEQMEILDIATESNGESNIEFDDIAEARQNFDVVSRIARASMQRLNDFGDDYQVIGLRKRCNDILKSCYEYSGLGDKNTCDNFYDISKKMVDEIKDIEKEISELNCCKSDDDVDVSISTSEEAFSLFSINDAEKALEAACNLNNNELDSLDLGAIDKLHTDVRDFCAITYASTLESYMDLYDMEYAMEGPIRSIANKIKDVGSGVKRNLAYNLSENARREYTSQADSASMSNSTNADAVRNHAKDLYDKLKSKSQNIRAWYAKNVDPFKEDPNLKKINNLRSRATGTSAIKKMQVMIDQIDSGLDIKALKNLDNQIYNLYIKATSEMNSIQKSNEATYESGKTKNKKDRILKELREVEKEEDDLDANGKQQYNPDGTIKKKKVKVMEEIEVDNDSDLQNKISKIGNLHSKADSIKNSSVPVVNKLAGKVSDYLSNKQSELENRKNVHKKDYQKYGYKRKRDDELPDDDKANEDSKGEMERLQHKIDKNRDITKLKSENAETLARERSQKEKKEAELKLKKATNEQLSQISARDYMQADYFNNSLAEFRKRPDAYSINGIEQEMLAVFDPRCKLSDKLLPPYTKRLYDLSIVSRLRDADDLYDKFKRSISKLSSTDSKKEQNKYIMYYKESDQIYTQIKTIFDECISKTNKLPHYRVDPSSTNASIENAGIDANDELLAKEQGWLKQNSGGSNNSNYNKTKFELDMDETLPTSGKVSLKVIINFGELRGYITGRNKDIDSKINNADTRIKNAANNKKEQQEACRKKALETIRDFKKSYGNSSTDDKQIFNKMKKWLSNYQVNGKNVKWTVATASYALNISEDDISEYLAMEGYSDDFFESLSEDQYEAITSSIATCIVDEFVATEANGVSEKVKSSLRCKSKEDFEKDIAAKEKLVNELNKCYKAARDEVSSQMNKIKEDIARLNEAKLKVYNVPTIILKKWTNMVDTNVTIAQRQRTKLLRVGNDVEYVQKNWSKTTLAKLKKTVASLTSKINDIKENIKIKTDKKLAKFDSNKHINKAKAMHQSQVVDKARVEATNMNKNYIGISKHDMNVLRGNESYDEVDETFNYEDAYENYVLNRKYGSNIVRDAVSMSEKNLPDFIIEDDDLYRHAYESMIMQKVFKNDYELFEEIHAYYEDIISLESRLVDSISGTANALSVIFDKMSITVESALSTGNYLTDKVIETNDKLYSTKLMQELAKGNIDILQNQEAVEAYIDILKKECYKHKYTEMNEDDADNIVATEHLNQLNYYFTHIRDKVSSLNIPTDEVSETALESLDIYSSFLLRAIHDCI